MNSVRKTLSEQFLDSTFSQQDSEQWETLIARLLQRLELPSKARAEAERMYNSLGKQIADNLGTAYENILIYPQGSMRTQTTVNPRHPRNLILTSWSNYQVACCKTQRQMKCSRNLGKH